MPSLQKVEMATQCLKKAYEEGRVLDLGLSDWENLREHLLSLEALPTETEGRIVDISAK